MNLSRIKLNIFNLEFVLVSKARWIFKLIRFEFELNNVKLSWTKAKLAQFRSSPSLITLAYHSTCQLYVGIHMICVSKLGINLTSIRVILWQSCLSFPFRFSCQAIMLWVHQEAYNYFVQFCKVFHFIIAIITILR